MEDFEMRQNVTSEFNFSFARIGYFQKYDFIGTKKRLICEFEWPICRGEQDSFLPVLFLSQGRRLPAGSNLFR